MPLIEWLEKEFSYGYSSGNVLSIFPNKVRRLEEKRIGGSYRQVVYKGILPYITKNSKVLELGPGKGSWTRAILKYIPEGEIHTVDFQDVKQWLKPEKYNGRLICHKIENDDYYTNFDDDYFDFIWSFGVLCHNNSENIEEILKTTFQKIKKRGYAVHQFSDWDKLEKFGWQKGAIPEDFKNKNDNEIWWPRNNQDKMAKIAVKAGWQVITSDLNIVKRDSIIVLQK